MTCGRLSAALGLVMLMAVSATATTPLVSDGLVLYFGFDGMTAGSRGVVDGSPNGADGTVVRGCYEELGIRGTGVRIAEAVLNNFNPKDLNGDGLAGDGLGGGVAADTWTYTNVLPTPYDPDVEPEDNPWSGSGTVQDPFHTPVNRDYNYIWMLPSDIHNIPTSGFSESVWVKVEKKIPAAYPGDNTNQATFSTLAYQTPEQGGQSDYRCFPIHLEIRSSDKYRTTLRNKMTAGNIINVGDMATPAATYDEWNHLVWTYDQTADKLELQQDPLSGEWSWVKVGEQPEVKFYLNGELKNTYNLSTSPATLDLPMVGNWDWGARIGCNVDNGRQFTGVMDELYIFDRALTQAEVTTLHSGFTQSAAPILGDANLDGVVDDEDASILGKNWQCQWNATWLMGDFNDDQKVDDKDAAILAAHWGEHAPGAEVPEPSTVVLLLGAVAALLVWRRRG
jgi:hypothetical protein